MNTTIYQHLRITGKDMVWKKDLFLTILIHNSQRNPFATNFVIFQLIKTLTSLFNQIKISLDGVQVVSQYQNDIQHPDGCSSKLLQ